MSDEFIGTIIETKAGSTYTVVGVNGLKGSSRKYKVECSVCSSDKELFESIWLRKGDLLSGKLSCGCSSRFNYSERQNLILCKRKAALVGANFIGFTGEYLGIKTKVEFVDSHNITQSNMYLSYFLKRYEPNNRVRASAKNVARFDDSHYSDKLVNKFNFPQGTILRRVIEDGNLTSKFSVYCPVCAKSDLCLSGVSSPWFEAHYANLCKGNKPCFCSPVYRYSKEEYEQRLKTALIGFGTFVSISDNFSGSTSRFKWTCDCGSERDQAICDFLSGRRCPNCASHGFKDDKPANLYAVLWSCGEHSFVKVGITNNSVSIRLQQQQLNTKFKPKEILEIFFEKGFMARKLEKEILGQFKKDSSVTKEVFSDGYTEVLDKDSFQDIKRVLENYANHS